MIDSEYDFADHTILLSNLLYKRTLVGKKLLIIQM